MQFTRDKIFTPGRFISKSCLVFLLLCLDLALHAQICKCKPSTSITKQERTVSKHEKYFGSFKVKKKIITPRYIVKWDKLYEGEMEEVTDRPESEREQGTPEDTMYTLRGYMWFVSKENNDCDFHIEIGGKNESTQRVIVEVPQENKILQRKIKNHLDSLDLKILDCGYSGNKAHFSKGLPVLVRGLGFFDASHRTDGNHGDAHTNEHVWELHPVLDIDFY
jgi:hypothetical protein